MKNKRERYRPQVLKAPNSVWTKIGFRLRALGDLQLASILLDVAPVLKALGKEKVADVGCGDMPYRHLIRSEKVQYIGLDILESPEYFGYSNPGAVRFDGGRIPIVSSSMDLVLCTEVLEHHPHPERLIAEMRRILKPGGRVLVTVPWSARMHFIPNDYHRFTRYQLDRLFAEFENVKVSVRGTDLSVICNKVIVLMMRNLIGLRRGSPFAAFRFLGCLPMLPLALILGYLGLYLRVGSEDDPLGFTIQARTKAN